MTTGIYIVVKTVLPFVKKLQVYAILSQEIFLTKTEHPKTCIFTVLLVKCCSRTLLSRKVFALPHLLCDIMANDVSTVLYLLLTAYNGLPISLRFLISTVILSTILQAKR